MRRGPTRRAWAFGATKRRAAGVTGRPARTRGPRGLRRLRGAGWRRRLALSRYIRLSASARSASCGGAVVREHGGAGAGREANRAAGPHLDRDPRTTASCSSRRLISAASARAVREDDDELVAGVADAEVVGAERRLQRRRDLAERPVADVVAVGVVDRLELVDVHDDHADFALEALGPRQLARRGARTSTGGWAARSADRSATLPASARTRSSCG